MISSRVNVRQTVVAVRGLTQRPASLLACASVLGGFAVLELFARTWAPGRDLVVPLGYDINSALLGLGATVPLVMARTHLVVAALTVSGAAMLTVVSGESLTVAGTFTFTVLAYLLGRLQTWRWPAVMILPLLIYSALFSTTALGTSVSVILSAVAALVGMYRRHSVEALRREASDEAAALTLAEHTARGERARIVRELHDVVAHHISMIAVQAEAARLATPGMPAEGGRRLTAIANTARQALSEMRGLLGVLREDAEDLPAHRAPQPGLQQLNLLVDEARKTTSMSTRLIMRGRVAPLNPVIELTAYRIIQEALTNTRKHAPRSAVDVELDFTDEALVIRVRDNGPGPLTFPGAAGHGQTGMRERVALAGGTMRSGPAPAGGFLMEAVLPREPGQ